MPHSREVRLGLVLYGGVSLAVYENGIAQEFYRAICATGMYRLIADLTDSDIVVDIISGTSAGGVNGIMLAYALANGRDFAPSAMLWRESAGIDALMGKPNLYRGMSVPSILDSDYYFNQLESCYGTTLGNAAAPSTFSPPEELDLFVTSTNANGYIATTYDDLGHPIDTKTHSALFKLKLRQDRWNDFTGCPAPLAKLSRMTSCFPVAFRPVRVQHPNKGTIEDKPLCDWGKLHDSAVFLDGGILNNKPFTSTIDSIATRTATREVERFLVYVEPDPESFENIPDAPPPAPNMASAAIESKLSIPGYQSIAADLRAIQDHNERATRLSEIIRNLRPAPPCTCSLATIPSVPQNDNAASPYMTARYVQLRDAAVEAILNHPDGYREYFPAIADVATDRRRSGRILVQSFYYWPGDGTDTLRNYDVFYRRRRVKHLMNTLMRSAKDGSRVPEHVWDVINHCYKLYEIAQFSIVRWITVCQFHWEQVSKDHPQLDSLLDTALTEAMKRIAADFWGRVKKSLDDYLLANFKVPTQPTRQARKDFAATCANRIQPEKIRADGSSTLLEQIDAVLISSINSLETSADAQERSFGELLHREFCRFLQLDEKILLLQLGSGFESLDLIRVVRFSPADAKRCMSAGTVKSKVRGSMLADFGGFFRSDWRANDIMIGRFDSACLLAECLLTKERLAAVAAQQPQFRVTEQYIKECYGHLDINRARLLAQSINCYIANAASADSEAWESLINLIVCASHEGIVAEEWPEVLTYGYEQNLLCRQNYPSTTPLFAATNPGNSVWRGAEKECHQERVKRAREAIYKGQLPVFQPNLAPPTFLDSIPKRAVAIMTKTVTRRLTQGLLHPPDDPSSQPAPAPLSLGMRIGLAIAAGTVLGFAKIGMWLYHKAR